MGNNTKVCDNKLLQLLPVVVSLVLASLVTSSCCWSFPRSFKGVVVVVIKRSNCREFQVFQHIKEKVNLKG